MYNEPKTIKNIVSSIFGTKVDVATELLNQFDLSDIIVRYYNNLLNSSFSIDQVESVSASYLTSINNRISTVPDDKKLLLEYIVSDISKQLFREFVRSHGLDMNETIKRISLGIQNSCSLNGWDYEAVKRLFFDEIPVVSNISNQFYWYTWNASKENLNQLADDLKSHKVISRKNEFFDLFKFEASEKKIHIIEENRDIILVLFDHLNSCKLITARGLKAKKFTPLKYRMVDFDEEYLLKMISKRYFEKIKKNPVRMVELSNIAINWTKGF